MQAHVRKSAKSHWPTRLASLLLSPPVEQEFDLDLSRPKRQSGLRPLVFATLGATCGWLVGAVTLLLANAGGTAESTPVGPMLFSGATAAPMLILLGLSQRRRDRSLSWFGVCYALGLTTILVFRI